MSGEAEFVPLLEMVVAPGRSLDPPSFAEAAAQACSEAGARASVDRESGDLVLQGMSELMLGVALQALRLRAGPDLEVGPPQVAYRETLGCAARIDCSHKLQTPTAAEFARVIIVFEPGPRGSGFRFASTVADDQLPEAYVPAVRRGVEGATAYGLSEGFPVVDFSATLIAGTFHELDSSEAAFEAAGRKAFVELRTEGEPMLLEPIMTVEVTTPDACLDDLLADLKSRRGRVHSVNGNSDVRVITASVPLANMFGAVGCLYGMSRGLAEFSMSFETYAPVPVSWNDPPLFPPAMAMRA